MPVTAKPVTVKQVLKEIRARRKMSRETLYVHIQRNGIKPIGTRRQCPQLYPPDTAARILKPLGFNPGTTERNGR